VKTRTFNWPLWAGFLLSLIALFSYAFVFVNWEMTRDFPSVNLLLFAIALILLGWGWRRAFAPGRRRISKLVATTVAGAGVLVFAFFVFSFFVAGRWLPASAGAPKVGQKAPQFTLVDTNNNSVSLAQLLTTPVSGKAPKGVLVVFYRGYW
jgi:hypothetical protein